MNILDKIGSLGAIFAAAAAPCCFPMLAVVGSLLGLSFLEPYEGTMLYVFQGFILLALVGTLLAYRQHRKWLPLVIGVICAALVLYAVRTDFNSLLIYGGMAGLLLTAILNSIESRQCARC
jgi:MerC mercury resistance protein.